MTDTSRTLVIESSPARLGGYVALGLAMTVLAMFVAFVPGIGDPLGKLVGGYFGTVFFGVCTCVLVSRLLKSPRPVITISPEGICDARVAAAVIPWSAVTRISTWSYSGRRAVVLAIKPGIEPQLGLTRIARWTRGPNRALGADGLCITAAGLKIGDDTLLKLCQDYARQARGNEVRHQQLLPDHPR